MRWCMLKAGGQLLPHAFKRFSSCSDYEPKNCQTGTETCVIHPTTQFSSPRSVPQQEPDLASLRTHLGVPKWAHLTLSTRGSPSKGKMQESPADHVCPPEAHDRVTPMPAVASQRKRLMHWVPETVWSLHPSVPFDPCEEADCSYGVTGAPAS